MMEVRKSGFRRTIPLLITIFSLSFPAYAQYGGGTGKPNDPYLIYTAEQMNAIGAEPNDWDKHFKVMADIDLSAYSGTQFNMIGNDSSFPFTGVFDGSGHTISNFTYTSTGLAGLFGHIDHPNAHIKDLGLLNPNVESETVRLVGSLAGAIGEGTITNCYVVGGSVSGIGAVGGLIGANGYGIITNCYTQSGSVSGADEVGGLLGANGNGTITNCYVQGGSVVGTGFDVGGLVGLNWEEGTITKCYAVGSRVMGTGFYIGGLVGCNCNLVTNCYAVGGSFTETGFSVGGLVGYNDGLINNCYSAGSVSGMMTVGGLVGENKVGIRGGGEVIESFWDTQTSGRVTSDGGTGKTTTEMQMKSTFTDAGWDFVGETVNGTEDIWRILEGQDYPRLTWELLLDASAEDFVDVWLNDDPNTSGITRLIIGHKISESGSEMIVHGYGKAHPYDIDWGTIHVPYTGNPFVAVYEHGFKTNTLTIQLVNFDSLNVHSSNVFHDGTNRDYEADYFMHRAVGPEEIVINIDEDFEYVPQGWPLGLAPSHTPAVGLSSGPYEALIKEPEYGSGQVLYGYIPLGNSNDVKISLAVDTSDINNWLLYVDTNNNEDLTDDGLPYRNEGTGKLASLISLHVEVVSASGQTIARPYKLWIWFRETASPLFYARCHYRSQISIGEEQYTAIVYEIINHDALYRESGLWIDLNRDGKLEWDKSEEHFQDGAVISIEGKEYVLSLNYP